MGPLRETVERASLISRPGNPGESEHIMSLSQAISVRYPQPGEHGERLRRAVEEACAAFLASGLGDNNAEQRLSSTDNGLYWQQFSEVLLAHELQRVGLQPQHAPEGPDFLIEHQGRRMWVEVICPLPIGLPPEWVGLQLGEVGNLPHEAILLRWTAAIKEKAEKLLGNSARGVRGYLEKGIVRPEDAYAIAINGRLLRDGVGFPQLMGISQFPFAVEATFSVGPLQVHMDRDSLRAIGTDHRHRPLIAKPRGAAVPADTFLDPRFAPISAVWAVDVDESPLLGRPSPMVVVHNPLGRSPLPPGLLPAQSEYIADDCGDGYLLNRRDGRLSEGRA